MRRSVASVWGGVAHVFLAVALCLPLVGAAAMIGASMAVQDQSTLNMWLLTLLGIAFLAVVVWASLLPPVRQVEVSTARALLDHDDTALPDVRRPRAGPSRRRGAAWLALLVGVGLVVGAAILYLVPFGLELVAFPLSGESTTTWPLIGRTSHTGAGWHAVWLVAPGLLALVACLAVVGAASRLLVVLAPRVLGPTLTERVGIAAERERALARANAVARDLHDRLGHTLTAMTVQATAARRLLATDPQAAARAMAAVEDLGRRAQDDVDDVVRTLRDGAQPGAELGRGPVDVVTTARALVHESSLTVQLRAPAALLVDHGCADTAQAVIREALTNATRHGTGSATLRLHADEQSLWIEVRNPVGGRGRTAPERSGLGGLHERVLLGEGELSAGPEGGDSWLLTARLPIRRPEATR
ncbi:MAG TPA: histidine kinase [Nocardioides sp.]|uniref:sensor histidine kinase n=1 Tax=Nocardioides sp. TaxID=35761 RepID=UPI002E2EA54D|nr:histidine kinase [Nocardioides sp.]HEX5087967.1 histidine kinase [Nocardioides sp.]